MNIGITIQQTRHIRNFRQILMEHSYLMYKLVIAKKEQNLKEMMNIWVQINGLTDEWAYKITCNNTELSQDIRKMVMLYSDVLCDVIIDDRVDMKKIEDVIRLESKFLSFIGKTSTISEWRVYTSDILAMIKDPKIQHCFTSAENLGKAIDVIMYYKK